MTSLAWMRPKLAEMCGYSVRHDCLYLEHDLHETNFVMSMNYWRPDEDMAQAIRCLEAMHKNEQYHWRIEQAVTGILCSITTRRLMHLFRVADKAPSAICSAIAAAMGWEAAP